MEILSFIGVLRELNILESATAVAQSKLRISALIGRHRLRKKAAVGQPRCPVLRLLNFFLISIFLRNLLNARPPCTPVQTNTCSRSLCLKGSDFISLHISATNTCTHFCRPGERGWWWFVICKNHWKMPNKNIITIRRPTKEYQINFGSLERLKEYFLRLMQVFRTNRKCSDISMYGA